MDQSLSKDLSSVMEHPPIYSIIQFPQITGTNGNRVSVPEVWTSTGGKSNMLSVSVMLDGAGVRQVRPKSRKSQSPLQTANKPIRGKNGNVLRVTTQHKWTQYKSISGEISISSANLMWPLNWICITATVNNLTFSVWLRYLDKWWASSEQPHASTPNCPIAHHKTCVWKTRCCYILLELLLIGLSEYNSGSICRDITDGKNHLWGGFGEMKEVKSHYATACE